MSTKSAKELKVTLEHIKHQEETVKCQYDFFKHMTTLNTGGFLIIVALMGGESLHTATGLDLMPGVVIVIQTFGDRINFHPHIHVLITA